MVKHALEINAPRSLGVAESYSGWVEVWIGDWKGLLEHHGNALRYFERARNGPGIALSRAGLGLGYILSRDPESGRAQMEKGFSMFSGLGVSLGATQQPCTGS